MKKTILPLIAALLPCIPATLHSGEPVPVLPAGYGYYRGGYYLITDRFGKTHSGTVLGDSDFSMTIPSRGPISLRYLGMVVTLD